MLQEAFEKRFLQADERLIVEKSVFILIAFKMEKQDDWKMLFGQEVGEARVW